MTKPKPFVCWKAPYMNYGFISNYSLCTQPPIACPAEVGESIKLQTGRTIQIFYCTRQPDTDSQKPTEQKGLYTGLLRNGKPAEERTNGPSCLTAGRK